MNARESHAQTLRYLQTGRAAFERLKAINERRQTESRRLAQAIEQLVEQLGPGVTAAALRERLPEPRPTTRTVRRHLAALRAKK
jgi:hypothetical protein